MTIHQGTIMTASHQWASRPNDQRFTSLTEMLAYKNRIRQNSQAKVISSRSIEAVAVEGDIRGLQIVGPNGGAVNPTNWSFGQMCGLVSAPAKYLRDLAAPLAADCLNYGFLRRDVEDVGVLLYQDVETGMNEMSAMTGPNYGRVWDATLIEQLTKVFGDGVTGDFKVPGEFGKDVPITKQNTTLYASDRDMFVFLADEKNRIEVPGRRRLGDGTALTGSMARGVFVWNSEVGSKTYGVATFLFDYVCMNRIIWGADRYREITIRHTASAPDKFIEQVAPAIEDYSQSGTQDIVTAIENAKARKLETSVEEFLAKRTKFSGRMIRAMVAAHEADEQRPMETIFDAVTGVTAYARGLQHQDTRVEVERVAGGLLDLVAA